MVWRAGVEPTDLQRMEHYITHLPYAWWCSACVGGRGRDDPHPAVPGTLEGPPVLQLDYSFMRSAVPDDQLATCLLGKRARKGYGFVCKRQCKGGQDTASIDSLTKWLNEAGLATGMLRLRTDAEPAIRSVAAVLMQRRRPGDTILEVTPVASSSSLGGAE